jgi:tRNA threonylcarbamoyladenosine biosynthesis protein TsaE
MSARPAQATRTIRTRSRSETVGVGASIAEFLRAGDVVILSGELGAGKTALSSGIIAALGCGDQVTSPTFTIMRHHPLAHGGEVLHLDAYRLTGPDDAEDIGLLELLDRGAIAIIEWGERIADALGQDLLVVTMRHMDDADGVDRADDDREIHLEGVGPRWAHVDLSAVKP